MPILVAAICLEEASRDWFSTLWNSLLRDDALLLGPAVVPLPLLQPVGSTLDQLLARELLEMCWVLDSSGVARRRELRIPLFQPDGPQERALSILLAGRRGYEAAIARNQRDFEAAVRERGYLRGQSDALARIAAGAPELPVSEALRRARLEVAGAPGAAVEARLAEAEGRVAALGAELEKLAAELRPLRADSARLAEAERESARLRQTLEQTTAALQALDRRARAVQSERLRPAPSPIRDENAGPSGAVAGVPASPRVARTPLRVIPDPSNSGSDSANVQQARDKGPAANPSASASGSSSHHAATPPRAARDLGEAPERAATPRRGATEADLRLKALLEVLEGLQGEVCVLSSHKAAAVMRAADAERRAAHLEEELERLRAGRQAELEAARGEAAEQAKTLMTRVAELHHEKARVQELCWYAKDQAEVKAAELEAAKELLAGTRHRCEEDDAARDRAQENLAPGLPPLLEPALPAVVRKLEELRASRGARRALQEERDAFRAELDEMRGRLPAADEKAAHLAAAVLRMEAEAGAAREKLAAAEGTAAGLREQLEAAGRTAAEQRAAAGQREAAVAATERALAEARESLAAVKRLFGEGEAEQGDAAGQASLAERAGLKLEALREGEERARRALEEERRQREGAEGRVRAAQAEVDGARAELEALRKELEEKKAEHGNVLSEWRAKAEEQEASLAEARREAEALGERLSAAEEELKQLREEAAGARERLEQAAALESTGEASRREGGAARRESRCLEKGKKRQVEVESSDEEETGGSKFQRLDNAASSSAPAASGSAGPARGGGEANEPRPSSPASAPDFAPDEAGWGAEDDEDDDEEEGEEEAEEEGERRAPAAAAAAAPGAPAPARGKKTDKEDPNPTKYAARLVRIYGLFKPDPKSRPLAGSVAAPQQQRMVMSGPQREATAELLEAARDLNLPEIPRLEDLSALDAAVFGLRVRNEARAKTPEEEARYEKVQAALDRFFDIVDMGAVKGAGAPAKAEGDLAARLRLACEVGLIHAEKYHEAERLGGSYKAITTNTALLVRADRVGSACDGICEHLGLEVDPKNNEMKKRDMGCIRDLGLLVERQPRFGRVGGGLRGSETLPTRHMIAAIAHLYRRTKDHADFAKLFEAIKVAAQKSRPRRHLPEGLFESVAPPPAQN